MSGVTAGRTDYYLGGGYEREDGWRQATGARQPQRLPQSGPARCASAASACRPSAPSPGRRRRDRCRRASSTLAPRPTSPSATSRISTCCRASVSGYAPVGPGRGIVHGLRAPVACRAVQRQPGAGRQRPLAHHQRHPGRQRRLALEPPRSAEARSRSASGADGVGQPGAHPAPHRDPGRRRPTRRSRPTCGARAGTWRATPWATTGMGRVTLSGGFRYDYIRIPFEDQLDPAADTTNSFSRLSPRGGVSVDVGPGRQRLRLGGAELPRAGHSGARLRRRDGRLPAALCPGRRSAARSGGRHDVRDRRRSSCAGPPSSPPRCTAPTCATTSRSSSRRTRCSKASSPTSATPGARASSSGCRCVPSEAALALRQLRLHPRDLPGRRPRSSASGPTTPSPGRRWPEPTTSSRATACRSVPEHQVKAGGLVQPSGGVDLGLDLRYTGRQWLRGDEANETAPLGGYFTRASARPDSLAATWEVSAIVTNVFNSHARHLRDVQREPAQRRARALPHAARSPNGQVVVSRGSAAESSGRVTALTACSRP